MNKMNKMSMLTVALFTLGALNTSVYADDETKTTVKQSVDADNPNEVTTTKEVTKESDGDESSYKQKTTTKKHGDSSSTTTTTTTDDDD